MSPLRLGAALLAFALLSATASLTIAHRWDEAVTIWLQHAAPVPDVPAATLIFLADAEVVIPGVILANVLLLARHRAGGTAGWWLAAGLVGVSFLALALKYILAYPGPPLALQRSLTHRPGLGVGFAGSFPSGHTIRTTFLAGSLFRRVPALGVATVLAMMTALVYMGDHWTTDVLGGLCLGWACVEATRGLSGQLDL